MEKLANIKCIGYTWTGVLLVGWRSLQGCRRLPAQPTRPSSTASPSSARHVQGGALSARHLRPCRGPPRAGGGSHCPRTSTRQSTSSRANNIQGATTNKDMWKQAFAISGTLNGPPKPREYPHRNKNCTPPMTQVNLQPLAVQSLMCSMISQQPCHRKGWAPIRARVINRTHPKTRATIKGVNYSIFSLLHNLTAPIPSQTRAHIRAI
jgi:hypothetical protein